MRSFFLFLCVVVGGVVWGEGIVLDLETAWQKVVKNAPALADADAEIAANKADREQASLLPNPILTVVSGDFGVGDLEGDSPETLVELTQLFEMGGKRYIRSAVAAFSTDLAYWDAQIARWDLRAQFATAFIQLAIAQEKLKLAQEQELTAQCILECIQTKVEGGKISVIEAKRAGIDFKRAQLNTWGACSDLAQAKVSLSLLWGCPGPDFDSVLFPLFECSPPDYSGICEGFYQTPDFARAKADISLAAQNIKLQRANGVPDVSVGVGYTVVHNHFHQNGWLVELDIPLPIFDRNQGNIRRACIEKGQAEVHMEEIVRDLEEQIFLAHEGVVISFEESEMIRNEVLAEAMETLDLVQTGHQNGKFDYSDLLGARYSIFEIQEMYLEALRDYHLNRVLLDRLTGQGLCTP